MDYKRYIPHCSAIVIFVIITAIFFSPLFDGKRVKQHDVTMYLGMSKEIKDFRDVTGEEALWTNSMFGGMPAFQISIEYPSNLVSYIQKFFIKIFPFPATAILLCMIGFYFLLLTFKIDSWLCIGGAIAFGFSSFFIIVIGAGHNTQILAISYMAPVLMGFLITLRGRLWLGGAITALSLAVELNANHLQITYYLLIVILLVGLGEAIRLVQEKKINYLLKSSGILSVAVFLAVLPNLSNLYLTNEYGKASIRGKSEITIDSIQHVKTSGLPIDYVTQYSYGQAETFTLLIPDFNGGASEAISTYDEKALADVDDNFKQYVGGNFGAYFGSQGSTSGPVYVGAIICFLFVLGMFIVKDKIKWWLFAATVLSILLAWGKNFPGFTEFFLNYIPGYNKFRAVSMTLVIAEFTMPIVAMLAINEIVKNSQELKAKMKYFYISFAMTGGLALLVLLSPTSFVTTVSDSEMSKLKADLVQNQGQSAQLADEAVANLEIARTAIVSSDATRTFLFILITAVLLYFYIRKPFGIMPLAAALTLLLLFDMFGVGKRYLYDRSEKVTKYEKVKKNETRFPKSEADAFILNDKINQGADSVNYRVANLTNDIWSDGSTSYWHKSLGGYHGAKLKRIQELYEQRLSADIDTISYALQTPFADSILATESIVNMLNTKYFMFYTYNEKRQPQGPYVYTNTHACGSAWFVPSIKFVKNADAEINAVKNFNPKETAVVDERFHSLIGAFNSKGTAGASIKILSCLPNNLKYQYSAPSEQIAVFSEMYYEKGWNAYVDGKLTPHFRTDYVLRGMKVPAGNHTIEFKFDGTFYGTGEKIALAGSILLFLFLGGGIYMDVIRKKESTKMAA